MAVLARWKVVPRMTSQSETLRSATICRFAPGDILFAEGDGVDCVYRLRRGAVEIARAVGSERIVLGTVHEGEFLGEMAVIERRLRHSATARAMSECEAERFPADAFLSAVASAPGTAQSLLLRLSARRHAIEGLLAEAAGAPTPPLSLIPEGAAREQLGGDPLPVAHLPFIVGRKPMPGEAPSHREVALQLEDRSPFRLSRAHFAVQREGDTLILRDLDSRLGTMVNDEVCGHLFARDSIALIKGENHIVAGGQGSPFRFRLIVAAG